MREDEEKKTPHNDSGQSLKKKHREELIDESLEETFPASDPPSHIRIEGELKKDRLGNSRTKPGGERTANTKTERPTIPASGQAASEMDTAPETQKETKIDEAIDETFPASDPPASHHVEGEIKPEQVEENKNKTAEPRKPDKTNKKEGQRAKERESASR